MELSGLTAILFVGMVFVAGYLIGMTYAAWIVMIQLKAQGYTIDGDIQLQKLPEVTDAAQTQE